MKKYFLYLIIASSFLLYGENLELWSESAILIDYNTEEILFQKNIYKQLPPASMTKLVTIYKIFKEVNSGNITMNTRVPVSKRADWRNLPRDSSLMFIEEGQNVTVEEIVKGLAISSGNDAAIAIAELISGSMDNFIITINNDLESLGFKNLKFVDSSGFSDYNSINAFEFSRFIKLLIREFPDSLEKIFSLESFTYPLKSNGTTSIGPIKQFNRNKLITNYEGCDGLKTGYINKSGMNIALTAKRNDFRVIAVLIGAKDSNKKIAENKRLEDSIKLLDYAFKNYSLIDSSKVILPTLKVDNTLLEPYIFNMDKLLLKKNYTIAKYIINLNVNINRKDEDIGFVEIQSGTKLQKYSIRHK